VNIGSGIGSLEDIVSTTLTYSQSGYRRVSPLFIPRLLINLAAGHISIKNGFLGPSLSPSTACTTGAHAVGDSFHILRHSPDTRIMLAGASESCISPVGMAGFARARSLATAWNDDPGKSSRPFDKSRDGFVMSEGAAVLVLEELEHAKSRGANIYAEIIGYGTASDAHHITAPHPDGQGAYLSMSRALRDAKIHPEKVDYINAHATGTILGDAAENKAIRRLMLGDNGKTAPEHVNVSSIKGALGHLLGASGAVEAVSSVLSVQRDVLPPTINLDEVGDANGQGTWDLNYVPGKKQERTVDVGLSNSFGFGGTCASLCFRKYTGD
jgi:3-oxoacyl-[acyl-carrier-protein] synthase II